MDTFERSRLERYLRLPGSKPLPPRASHRAAEAEAAAEAAGPAAASGPAAEAAAEAGQAAEAGAGVSGEGRSCSADAGSSAGAGDAAPAFAGVGRGGRGLLRSYAFVGRGGRVMFDRGGGSCRQYRRPSLSPLGRAVWGGGRGGPEAVRDRRRSLLTPELEPSRAAERSGAAAAADWVSGADQPTVRGG